MRALPVAIAVLCLAASPLPQARAADAHIGVHPEKGEMVLLRDVSPRAAYRPAPPGIALIVDPKPNREIHGSLGSLVGRDVMTQRPVGEVRLRTADGERVVAVEPHNLYAHSLAAFNRAVQGQGAPAATGEDGLRSLAAALAVLEAARTGGSTPVQKV